MPTLHGNVFSSKSVTETVMNVPSGSWVALPATAMSGRALVEVHNKGETKLYFSFDNTISHRDRAAIGSGSFRIFPIQDNLILYGRSHAGGTKAIIVEYK